MRGAAADRRAAGRAVTPADPAVALLLASSEPGIRQQARRDLLDEPAGDDERAVPGGPKVSALLAGQEADGGFGGHPYQKWGGVHWRLVSLVELGVPAGEPRAMATADRELSRLTGAAQGRAGKKIDGLTRICASLEGNALAACCQLGLAADPHVEPLARTLAGWQCPTAAGTATSAPAAGGRPSTGGCWWRYGDESSGPAEVVDWGRHGPSEMLTLNALQVLRAGGR